MNLIKIYDNSCDVCQMLAGLDEQVAEDNSFFFRKMTLKEVASNPSHIRDYTIQHYVEPNDGMVDIPIYLITSTKGKIEASGVVKTIEELNNLISSWKKWESSQKSSSPAPAIT